MSDDVDLRWVIERLSRSSVLDDADRAAVLALPATERTVQAASYLVREGQPPRSYCSVVASGFAFRQKLTAEGARQIVSLQMRGDFLDLQHLYLSCADHSIQALTLLKVIDVERQALQRLMFDRPAVGRALLIEQLIEASIHREWILNVGRRDARSKVAHVLCEFALRSRSAGLSQAQSYTLPMTQEQLGDAVGLTSVHVNRTIRALVQEGLLRFDRRQLTILDWDRIREVGDFSSLYLHLDQTAPELATDSPNPA
jgi:CRP-like cAMP-binding protein